jgi:hypothetical protein
LTCKWFSLDNNCWPRIPSSWLDKIFGSSVNRKRFNSKKIHHWF